MGKKVAIVLRALSSQTRVEIIKALLKDQMHITALAKRLGISVPVAAKHVRILEKAGLIERREYGRSHILRARGDRIYGIFDAFAERLNVKLSRGSSVLDALKMTCAVETKRVNDSELLISIDGKEGYYLYEVNSRLADIPMNNYKVKNNDEILLKRLIPITEKKITVNIR
ncbi:helix-turn-helix domain-containing protein [Candidatus Bathyarchaeota archaeon]|nr:helix-turn-helix domain-containing protein [Candidatus Bathyarchaeota archaeon]MBS7628610.1 helix-turn-helix domain-containing protein [Candidatus Bathyarchaeota archaeon]